MRQALNRIQIYDEEGNIAAIINELVSFIKLVILFENIYAEPEAI